MSIVDEKLDMNMLEDSLLQIFDNLDERITALEEKKEKPEEENEDEDKKESDK